MRIIFEDTPKDGSLCSVPYNNINYEEPLVSTTISLENLHHLYINGSVNGIVNGLVLVSAYKDLRKTDYTLVLLNPTTKDYVELPTLLCKQVFGMKGFGFDSVSGDYKVVVFSRGENYDGDVYLYNINTNTMKLVMSRSPYQDYQFTMLPGVFVNGFLHWIFNNRSTQELVIVAFSLGDDNVTELSPPSQVDLSDMDTKLVSLGDDKLAIFDQVKGDMWVMNEYGVEKSWTKILDNGFDDIPLSKPVVFYDNGTVLFLTGHRLGIYDAEEKTFSKSVDVSYMKIKYFIGAYAESLVSPKEIIKFNGR